MFLFITKFRWVLKAFLWIKKYVSIMNFETFICVFPLGKSLVPKIHDSFMEDNKRDLRILCY